jgi:hypothetical protein
MRVCFAWSLRCLAAVLALSTTFCAGIVRAQEKQHVVSLEQLNSDAARPTAARQANEAAVRQLFSSEQAQQALQSANIDYAKVDRAIGQLSDEDLAKMAQRSREAQENFAAGRAGSLSDRDLLIIVIVAVLLIALIAVLR